MPDIILFHANFVAQHRECHQLLEAVMAEARLRQFPTLEVATTCVTAASLRAAGLRVATPADRHRHAAQGHHGGGGEAA